MPRSRSGSAAESPAESDDWVAAQFNQVHSHIAVGTRAGWRIVACSPFAQVLQQSVEGGISSGVHALHVVADRARRAWRPRGRGAAAAAVEHVQLVTRFRAPLCQRRAARAHEQEAAASGPRGRDAPVRAQHDADAAHARERAEPARRGGALLRLGRLHLRRLAGRRRPGWQGKLVLFDGSHGHPLCTVAAHQSGISCAALDTRGELLATASEKGTVIRVHLVPNGGAGAGGDSGGLSSQLLYTLRRGTARATIHSLSFAVSGAEADHAAAAAATAGDGASSGDAGGRPSASAEGAGGAGAASPHDRPLLCCASSTGTVHVWRLGVSRTHLRMARGLISAASPYKADAARDFARVKLKLAPGANWCAAAIYVGADAALPAAAAAGGGGGAVDVTDGGSMRASASGWLARRRRVVRGLSVRGGPRRRRRRRRRDSSSSSGRQSHGPLCDHPTRRVLFVPPRRQDGRVHAAGRAEVPRRMTARWRCRDGRTRDCGAP